MNGFKERLKRELREDVPFTNDVKRRLLQPKQQPRKNWRVAAVSVVACCLVVLLASTLLFPQQDALRFANSGKELLPIVEVADGEVIEPDTGYLLGEQWMFHGSPMVVDQDAPVTYGDYVAYYTPREIVVSTVLGLANDTVVMGDGLVTVDGTVLTVRGLGEKITAQIKKDPFKNPYYFYSWGEDKDFINETIEIAKDELVVYSNEEGHRLVKITEAQLIGKVTALYQTKQAAFQLLPEEQALYDAFKLDYNLERLRDVSPVVIVKMFLLSEMEKDFETYEALFTTVENNETREVKQYYETTRRVREEMFTRELNEMFMTPMLHCLEDATFEQETATKGWVKFFDSDGTETGLGMTKNEQGIWQPSFSRAIYFPLE